MISGVGAVLCFPEKARATIPHAKRKKQRLESSYPKRTSGFPMEGCEEERKEMIVCA